MPKKRLTPRPWYTIFIYSQGRGNYGSDWESVYDGRASFDEAMETVHKLERQGHRVRICKGKGKGNDIGLLIYETRRGLHGEW